MQNLTDQKQEFDSLTGFYTREGLLKSAENDVDSAEGLTKPVALIYLDLHDYAKFVKERGEVEGNSLLLFVGSCIRKCIQKNALTGRIHADEFVIVLPGVDPDRAMNLQRRLRRTLHKELQTSNFDVKECIGGITYLTYPASIEKTLQTLERVLHDLKQS